MATRAAWRTAPGEPRLTGGWAVRDGRRWAVFALLKGLLALFLVGLYAVSIGRGYVIVPLFLASLGLVRLFPDPERFPEAADPAPEDSFRGKVQILRDGAWLGEDRVVATFVDGWLHVEGFRTAFALRSVDVAEYPPSRLEAVRRSGQKPGSVVLTDGLELRFSVAPCRRPTAHDPGRMRLSPFDEVLVRWVEGASPVGESILPPADPHPLAWARAWTDLLVSTLAVLLAASAFALYGPLWGAVAFVLVPGPSITQSLAALRRLVRVGRGAQ